MSLEAAVTGGCVSKMSPTRNYPGRGSSKGIQTATVPSPLHLLQTGDWSREGVGSSLFLLIHRPGTPVAAGTGFEYAT